MTGKEEGECWECFLDGDYLDEWQKNQLDEFMKSLTERDRRIFCYEVCPPISSQQEGYTPGCRPGESYPNLQEIAQLENISTTTVHNVLARIYRDAGNW